MAARTLAELMATVEKRKSETIRLKLGISPHHRIEGIELESLAYHLTERSGAALVQLIGDQLRVGEPGQSTGLTYRGDALEFLLATWKITREEAATGVTIQVQNGKRVG